MHTKIIPQEPQKNYKWNMYLQMEKTRFIIHNKSKNLLNCILLFKWTRKIIQILFPKAACPVWSLMDQWEIWAKCEISFSSLYNNYEYNWISINLLKWPSQVMRFLASLSSRLKEIIWGIGVSIYSQAHIWTLLPITFFKKSQILGTNYYLQAC